MLGSQFEPWVSSLRGVQGNGVSDGEAWGLGVSLRPDWLGTEGIGGESWAVRRVGPERGLLGLVG